LTDAERARIAAERELSNGVREELEVVMQIDKQSDELSPTLYEKKVLCQRRVSVLHGGILSDFQRVLQYGYVYGPDTEDETKEMKECVGWPRRGDHPVLYDMYYISTNSTTCMTTMTYRSSIEDQVLKVYSPRS